MKKLSTPCHIIRNVKTYICFGIKNNLSGFFHSAMSDGIIFWGNSSQEFHSKKSYLGLLKDVGTEFHVETYSRN
jgi:hypothetical protein